MFAVLRGESCVAAPGLSDFWRDEQESSVHSPAPQTPAQEGEPGLRAGPAGDSDTSRVLPPPGQVERKPRAGTSVRVHYESPAPKALPEL
jgi:hypothetical protein